MAADARRYQFVRDTRGMMWDLVLYVPTAIALIIVGSRLWFSGDEGFAYVVVFATTFIILIGFNRIFKTRLMMLPSAPTSLSVSKAGVDLTLKSGVQVQLVKNVRFFSDLAGRSIGLTGIDLSGKSHQHIFHKGQFASESEFGEAKASLRVFK